MMVVCFKCGNEKEAIFGACEHCQSLPNTEEELVLSALLSEYLLDKKFLHVAKESEHYRDPKKISKGAYDLIANFLREDGILPNPEKGDGGINIHSYSAFWR